MLQINDGWNFSTTFFKDKVKLVGIRRGASFFLVVLGLSVSGFGISELYAVNAEKELNSEQADIAICEKKPDFEQITVYVSGAVENPGIYVLDLGSRKADALQEAGGLSSLADKVSVHKKMNLAAVLSDGETIYIPNQAEALDEIRQNLSSDEKKVEKNDSPISINSSDIKLLQELDGVGEVRAQKIIDNRPYGSLEELVTNKILSQTVYEKNKEKIAL